MLSGTDPLGMMASQLFGSVGVKIVYLCVIISILGTVNGIVLGYLRVPYALSLRTDNVLSKKLSQVDPKTDTPVNSAIFCYIVSIVMMMLHMVSTNGISVFSGLEVDNLPIVMNYFFLVTLYVGVMTNSKFSGLSAVKRYVIPALAIIGACVVIYGGITKPHFNVYMIISLVIIGIGYFTKTKKKAEA